LRRHHAHLAGAEGGGGRSRVARGDAAPHDPRRSEPPRPAPPTLVARSLSPMTKSPGKGSTPPPRGVAVALRTARGRTTASQRWLARQLNDPYVVAAKQQGWRSRAAFKLIELDD